MPRGVKKGLSPSRFDRCVTKVKRKGSAKNAYAVRNAKMGRGRKGRLKSQK